MCVELHSRVFCSPSEEPICSGYIPFHTDGWVRYSICRPPLRHMHSNSHFLKIPSRAKGEGFRSRDYVPREKILACSCFYLQSTENKTNFYKVYGLPTVLAGPGEVAVCIKMEF